MLEEQQQNDKNDAAAGLTTESAAPIVDVVQNSQKIGETIDITKQFAKNDPKISKGEKVFDWSVYNGLNYWVCLIISVAMADKFLTKGTAWNKWMESAIEKTTLAVHKSGVDLKTAHSKSRSGMKFLSLLSGGYALLIPLKILEDNKRKVVHWLNDKMGVDQTAPDGHKLTEDEIHVEGEQPKQSWWNVLGRRLMGTAAVVGSGLALNHLYQDKNTIVPDEIVKIGEHTIVHEGRPLGGDERMTGKITGLLNKALKHLPFGYGEKVTKIGGTPNRWINLLALDTFFTVITASVMYFTRGAKKAKMPHEIDNSGDVPSHDKIPDQIVPDEVDDGKKTNYSAKFAPRDKEKPISQKNTQKKSLAPEEFLGMNKGESAQVGFA